MYKKVLSVLFIIIALCCCVNAYSCKKVVLKKRTDLQSQLRKENVIYIVKYDFDLKGGMISIPKGCILNFQGGCLNNGTIQGNGTVISAKKVRVFEKVVLTGSWTNKKVYSEWFDFVEGKMADNSLNFNNLMLLCAGDEMTDLYMQKGFFYCSIIIGSSSIIVPSNVYWHNEATICQLPTNSPKYSFVLLHKSDNVTIDGGEFVGDVQTHTGTDGEWGHGIKLAGATNVVLKNFVSREFWGDGIDLIEADYVSSISAGVGPCEGITIDNVKCLYNRRQGLSIEAAKNVVVKNSEFAYTGKYKITSPGAGIDIEPWCKNEEKVDNIRFYNCSVHDNNPKGDFCIESNIQYHVKAEGSLKTPENRIEIDNCQTGKLYIYGANKVAIRNCMIDEITGFQYGEAVNIEDCTFERKTDLKPRTGLTLMGCK